MFVFSIITYHMGIYSFPSINPPLNAKKVLETHSKVIKTESVDISYPGKIAIYKSRT